MVDGPNVADASGRRLPPDVLSAWERRAGVRRTPAFDDDDDPARGLPSAVVRRVGRRAQVAIDALADRVHSVEVAATALWEDLLEGFGVLPNVDDVPRAQGLVGACLAPTSTFDFCALPIGHVEPHACNLLSGGVLVWGNGLGGGADERLLMPPGVRIAQLGDRARLGVARCGSAHDWALAGAATYDMLVRVKCMACGRRGMVACWRHRGAS